MITEKFLACCLVASSGGTLVAAVVNGLNPISQQDAVAWIGILTTAGLACLNLYQKIREEKRKQDAADIALMATSDRAKAAQLSTENSHLRDQLTLMEAEVQRCLQLYQSIRPEIEPTGESR